MNERIKEIIATATHDEPDNQKKLLAYFDELVADSNWLGCLEAAGVDNWEGYCYAQEMSEEDE